MYNAWRTVQEFFTPTPVDPALDPYVSPAGWDEGAATFSTTQFADRPVDIFAEPRLSPELEAIARQYGDLVERARTSPEPAAMGARYRYHRVTVLNTMLEHALETTAPVRIVTDDSDVFPPNSRTVDLLARAGSDVRLIVFGGGEGTPWRELAHRIPAIQCKRFEYPVEGLSLQQCLISGADSYLLAQVEKLRPHNRNFAPQPDREVGMRVAFRDSRIARIIGESFERSWELI